MIKNMSKFSLAAYESLKESGEINRREREVLEALIEHGPMTREEIARVTGMKEGSACARVNALIEKNKLVEVSCKRNSVTNKMNGVVDLSLTMKAVAA